MGKFSIANLRKLIYYLRRNGLRSTFHAAKERLGESEKYEYHELSAQEREELTSQAEEMVAKWKAKGQSVPKFSILVPAYRTNPVFLKELVTSVCDQVYPYWELLILDATEDDSVRKALSECDGDAGIRYMHLDSNGGISENTNAGISYVTGDYVGLLDHDDVLTPDALYEMAMAIRGETKDGLEGCLRTPLVVYSDEDKWDGAKEFYDLNRKEDFNLDLLLSNNYVCHFLVMERELFCKLKLRKDFDGAQDYDLILRATAELIMRAKSSWGSEVEMVQQSIRHVPKVLYHWRCHKASTAENPGSKAYAYEAGKRALQDFADGQGWNAKARDLKHLGFYRLDYLSEKAKEAGAAGEGSAAPGEAVLAILENREDVGAVGGKIYQKTSGGNIVAGGRMAEDGSMYYEGLKEEFSGYLHRGVLTQDAEAVDLRCIYVSKKNWPLFQKTVGVQYVTDKATGAFDVKALPADADLKRLSIRFCKALREEGQRILWDPNITKYLS
ncbi:MAG: glycosyltransferase [Lachnospiraceae bacterium]|nr:glycosyltransferase [Lachnospiraceae bacterium]